MEIDVSDGGDTLLGTIFLLPDEASVRYDYPSGSFFYIDYDVFEPFFED